MLFSKTVVVATILSLAFTQLAQAEPIVTVYYNFEGNFEDFPGAGVNADDLVFITGGMLAADPAVNGPLQAQGSTMSYSFDNRGGNQTAQTNAWSPDLTSGDQYTIMFWYKGDNQNQALNNTRLATVRFTAPNAGGAEDTTGWQVEGFGQSSGDSLDLRIQRNPSPPYVGNFFSPNAVGALAGPNNDGNEDNDEWHHIAFVVSNTGSDNNGFAYIETYLDGVSLGQSENAFATGSELLRNLDGELIIGGQAGNRGATGLLDDFALFDGIVSDEDIMAIASGELSPADFLGQEVIPEPCTAWLLLGLVGSALARRGRK